VPYIFVVSDGTGITAEQTLRAALTQFTETDVGIELRPEIRTESQALAVVKEASEAGGFIVHTAVSKELRNCIADLGRLHNVQTIDLMGPLLAQLTQQLSNSPSERPGLFRELNKEYFQRIEAMEFAFRHDDGQRFNELSKADIVLIGVSCTFKTPLSIYLAIKGWLVGNVPIVLGISPPPVLFELSSRKVFGLTADAHWLAALRKVRDQHLGGATGEYANLNFIRRELSYAKRIFASQPNWTVIQVTNKPIEELASEIIARIRQQRLS
jgi:regulator of PEP synthase PpsR (kinase-PPPase family)